LAKLDDISLELLFNTKDFFEGIKSGNYQCLDLLSKCYLTIFDYNFPSYDYNCDNSQTGGWGNNEETPASVTDVYIELSMGEDGFNDMSPNC
jgi:hypothetical protein